MSDARRDAERPSYEQLDELIAVLRARIAQQDRVIAELRERLAANSRNGSRSPSSDGYRKPPVDKKPHRIRSLRQRSGRKAGGQDGHEGVHLERRAAVDRTVAHAPQGCSGCGGDLTGAEHLGFGETRQVIDLPPEVVLEVIDHVNVLRLCLGCGRVSVGVFPAGVGAMVQYGPRTRALGVYLIVFQHTPCERAARLIFDLAAIRVSTGTLKRWVDRAGGGLTDFDEQLRELLSDAPVCHFDETRGSRGAWGGSTPPPRRR